MKAFIFAFGVAAALTATPAAAKAPAVSPAEARAIAREAYVYGFPMVDSYRIQYSYFVDPANPDFKAPYNTLKNIPRVFTPDDKAVQTPNSDTPYSWIGLDLRAEPLVFTIPRIDGKRYWSAQLIDAYTQNFDYLGTRTTGNGGGSFVIAGPGWHGKLPKGAVKVIHSETSLAMSLFRTQLYSPDDLDNVKAIQAHYIVEPLSSFLKVKAPPPAPAIAFPKPLSADEQKTSPAFFDEMNFTLQFAPTDPSETALRARFAKLGIAPGKRFDIATLPPEMQQAIRDGMADGQGDLKTMVTRVTKGEVASGDVFGSRAFLKNDYRKRMVAAALGIYGNTKQEAMYPTYYIDASGAKLDGSHRYTLRFAPGQLPPVNAFWSLTMYEQPKSLLVANPINRYLLNSPMLDGFKRDADGSITLVIQNESPGKDREANWLPAPKGPFSVIMRLYWPKEAALDGSWKQPTMIQAE
jgi:hypothetical protein